MPFPTRFRASAALKTRHLVRENVCDLGVLLHLVRSRLHMDGQCA